MSGTNNDDIKSILEMLKEQAGNQSTEEKKPTQAADSPISSAEDLTSMLKKQFASDGEEGTFEASDDYSFETVDFGAVDEESMTGELPADEGEAIEADEADEVNEADAADEAEQAYVEARQEVIEEDDDEFTEEITDEYIDTDAEKFDDIIDSAVDEAVLENDEELDEIADEVVSERSESAFSDGEDEAPESSDDEEDDSKNIPEPSDDGEDEPEDAFEPSDEETDSEGSQPADVPAEELSDTELLYQKLREMNGDFEPTIAIEAISRDTDTPTQTRVMEIIESIRAEEAEEARDALEAEARLDSENEAISEESINYDEVLEGQQGTVLGEFVEDFTGDLDDVVFEAEITESRAPNKQYTIFEDWEKLMESKDYNTAEDGIIPPTAEEMAHSASMTERVSGNTDYFQAVETSELDAVDIALMVALGGEDELNKTVGFEKIRQAVHDVDEKDDGTLRGKDIYGCLGEEYTSSKQNSKIKQKYKKDRVRLIVQTSLTAVLALALVLYEVAGWIGLRLGGILDYDTHPEMYVLAGLQLLFFCAAVSYNKFVKMFKNLFDFSSTAFIGAVILLVLNIHHDVLVLTVGYAAPNVTFHSVSAVLLLLGLIYDNFDIAQQSAMFRFVSENDKKLVLEPYGKLRVSEDESGGEMIDRDSYCISRVPSLSKFFARMAKPSPTNSSKLISLILCLSVSLSIMLVLLLMGESFATIVLGFIISFSFTIVCSAIFETEFAFFTVYKALKKYKTGIIGKASVAEYSKCNIVYFDDFNVFNKKSVRTKGLKLYDNNEIYRVLYHTQAVFSKIGGPLKGVFEFATSEMNHSKDVEIRDISKEGIGAVVDGRTSVLIGTGSYMKTHGIHPIYTPLDMRMDERGEEGIMFIALGGSLCAKLYVTYQFSSEFERLAKKLHARGVSIGIRSCDPNVNNRWAKRYSKMKKMNISTVRPTLKEFKPSEKSIDGGLVSAKNVRALTEALMLCIRLDRFESLISKMRTVFVVLTGILAFALVLLSGVNTVSMLALTLMSAFCASLMMLLTHFYMKH